MAMASLTSVTSLAGSNNKNQEDGEIGVFSAEKYFNGGTDEESPRKYKKDKDSVKPNNLVHPAISAPIVHNECSWNSQTSLLQNVVQRKISPRKSSNKNIKHGVKNFNFLGCKYCSCSDKDSTNVDGEHVGEISFKKNPVIGSNILQVQPKPIIKKTSLDNLNHHHQKSISGSGSQIGIKNSASGKLQIQNEEVVKPRKSLEVFGSPVNDNRSKNFRIERRLSMLLPQKMEEIGNSNISVGGGVYNDNESEASSDLFEIESLTGKVNPYLARQESDATGYAPSEASVEWSVVTSSAADFSVISDFEEFRLPKTIPSPVRTSKEIVPKRSPGILLGSNNQKSVRVPGNAYGRTFDKTKADPRMMGRASESYMPVTRFPAENKLLMGFDA